MKYYDNLSLEKSVKKIRCVKMSIDNKLCYSNFVPCVYDKEYNEIILLNGKILNIVNSDIDKKNISLGEEYAVIDTIREIDWDLINPSKKEDIYDCYYKIYTMLNDRKNLEQEMVNSGYKYGHTVKCINVNGTLDFITGNLICGTIDNGFFEDIISGKRFECYCLRTERYSNSLKFGPNSEYVINEYLFPLNFLDKRPSEKKQIINSYRNNVKSKTKKI